MDHAARLTPDALLTHEAFVLRIARSLVRDEATARDVVQETWLSALEHPPAPGATRSWLARVTRNHAINLTRSRGRREARERAAARQEAVEGEPTSAERLELQHGVVRAVLELDEPYRSVVIAVHYDGLSPSELARVRGLPASTVRAQLSRGLDKLRARLDGEHGGERGAWCAALVGWLRREDALAATGASGGGVGAVAVWMGGAVLVVGAVVGWRVLAEDAEDVQQVANAVAPEASAQAPTPSAEVETREAVAAQPAPVTAADARERDDASDELAALGARALWIQDRVLVQRTTVEPALARPFAWIVGREDAGLVRLVDLEVFGERLDLPWLAGGGSTWSFSERTHDARRFGQLRYEQQGLGATSVDGGKGVVVDLGEGDLRGFATDPAGAFTGLDPDVRGRWELVAQLFDVNERSKRLLLQQALRDLRLDDEVEPEEGHLYLVRAFRPHAYDVLALLEVARVEDESCTLAWLLLESRQVVESLPAPPSLDDQRAALAPQPDLEGLDERTLLSELARVEAELQTRLTAASTTPAEAAAGVRRTTLVDRNSPLARTHAPDAEPWLYSFATGRHGARSEQDLSLEDGVYAMDFNARSISWFLDLGAVELADAERVAAERHAEAWTLMATAELPHFAPQAERVEAQVALARRGAELGLTNRVEGRVGHTYLVRSLFPTWHDQLVTFRLESRSASGDRIAWRVLRSWPVQER